MDIREYQRRSQKTDQSPGRSHESRVIPLLGMAGEVGSLLSEYKKRIRDGESHRMFRAEIEEELGDILWYLANTAEKFGIDLGSCAQNNLLKTTNRWMSPLNGSVELLDTTYPATERIPRYFSVEIREEEKRENGIVQSQVVTFVDGEPVGDPLTDNSYKNDGYRFHDIFHYAYAAVLGWSPITRRILQCKRKSDPCVDEVEDGARAAAIEEAVSAMTFEYAKRHNFFDGIETLDFELLDRIRSMTEHLEVRSRTAKDWEMAILEGFRIWRMVRSTNGGTFEVDLLNRSLHVA